MGLYFAKMSRLYLSTLGNDPIPALMGLRFAGGLGWRGKAVFLAERLWDGYEAKREAFLALLREEGVPYELVPAAGRDGALPQDLPLSEGVLVNLTGGSKLLAALLLERVRRVGGRPFLLDAHRPLERPRALLLWEPLGTLELGEGEMADLQDYLRLHLEPAGARWLETPPPPAFPQGARAVQLLALEDGVPMALEERVFFVVHLGQPYLVRPHLGASDREHMKKELMAAFAEQARRLGGELCRAVVPWHQKALDPHQRSRWLERWRTWAQATGVLLVDPGKPLGSIPRKPPLEPSEPPPPKAGPVLLAALSEQSTPLYGAMLAYKPRPSTSSSPPRCEPAWTGS